MCRASTCVIEFWWSQRTRQVETKAFLGMKRRCYYGTRNSIVCKLLFYPLGLAIVSSIATLIGTLWYQRRILNSVLLSTIRGAAIALPLYFKHRRLRNGWSRRQVHAYRSLNDVEVASMVEILEGLSTPAISRDRFAHLQD